MTAFSSKAGHMLGGGYSPLPLHPETGLPFLKKWDELRVKQLSLTSIASIIRQHPQAGLAVVGGYKGLVPIDIDTNDPAIIDAVCRALPAPVVVRVGSKGFVAFYRSDSDIAGRKFTPAGKDAKPLVEVLSKGVVTIPPTRHRRTGKPYRWQTKATLFNTRVEELSTITPAHMEALAKALEPWCPVKVYVPPVVTAVNTPVSDKRMQAWASRVLMNEVDRLRSLSSGRNWALYCAACKVARYVHHGVLTLSEVQSALTGASQLNGYTGKAGPHAVIGTIGSGIKKGSGDPLPVLQDKPRPVQYRPAYQPAPRP